MTLVQCCVCLEEGKRAIKPLSCGHRNLCLECYASLRQPACPMCRCPIENFQSHVFNRILRVVAAEFLDRHAFQADDLSDFLRTDNPMQSVLRLARDYIKDNGWQNYACWEDTLSHSGRTICRLIHRKRYTDVLDICEHIRSS